MNIGPWYVTHTGVILDSSLSLNEQIDYVKKKVSKMLGIFSRARLSLTIELANRLFKSMILPILDYCGAVFHRCGKGNEEGLECLQRRGGRIVLNTAHLSSVSRMTRPILFMYSNRFRGDLNRF